MGYIGENIITCPGCGCAAFIRSDMSAVAHHGANGYRCAVSETQYKPPAVEKKPVEPLSEAEEIVGAIYDMWANDGGPDDRLVWQRRYSGAIKATLDAERAKREAAEREVEAMRYLEARDVISAKNRGLEHALCMVLMWCQADGEPCDGFRFRGEVLKARELLGHKNAADDTRRAAELRTKDSTLCSASAAPNAALERKGEE